MFGAIPDLSLPNDVEHYDVSQRLYTRMQNFCRWLASLWAMASVIFERELKTRDIFATIKIHLAIFGARVFESQPETTDLQPSTKRLDISPSLNSEESSP